MQLPPNRTAGMEPVAIIGMASLFAEATDLATYWDNIVRERDSITDVPASRWNIADYYDPDPSAPDKTYCKRGGFLPDIDFDPLEFGLPPNILEVTDVSQLLALVTARQAFEDAGYGAERGHDFERTGVILGVCGGQKLMTPLIARLQYPIWEQAMRSCGLSEERIAEAIAKIKLAYIRWEENSFPGMLGNVIAGRIANRFDLGGINCVTDAACASSLSALQMALSELTSHRCDMMLTGGVDTDNSPFMYMCFSKTPAFSRREAPRPFDAEADGMMVGEGLGLLVLKRLADAERDGDRIYAVIRGIGSSSDGRYKSIYAPRSEGQARALRRAYANAGVPAASIGLIEAHGTGTVAGDLCEVQTLREVFSEGNPRQAHIALGSVKSQIGHTKAAAGAAGLIKAALALHHRVLPPTINVDAPNPKFGLEGSPLYLNTHARPWLRATDAPPRRAAVSAFGFGGTNFHVVLEEYAADHRRPYRLHQTAQEIILAAPTPDALHARCVELAEALHGPQAAQIFAELAAATRSLALPAEQARVGFVAEHPGEAREQLLRAATMIGGQPAAERLQHPKGVYYQRRGIDTAGRVVALFPGQGSQYLEMGRELALNFPPLRDLFGRADAHSAATPLSEVLFPPPAFTPAAQAAQTARLQRTEYAQPAIGALSMGMYGLLRDAGFQPAMTAGHSFGELTALWAAGALADDDYLALAHARGRAMAPPTDPSFDAGAMLAVAAEPATVQAIVGPIAGVTAANLNARDQVVLAGPTAAIDQARRLLQAAGQNATPLPVSAAFHTPLVGHAHAPFSRAVQACSFKTPRIPVYANATARPYPTDPQAIKHQLAEQLLQPVRFLEQIEQIYAAGGAIFVEIGPRSVLTNLVKRILGDRPHIAVALNPSREGSGDRQLREAVVQLRVAGVPMRGIDPYQREQPPTQQPKRRGLSIRLNGSNYVSEPTRAAYAEAIARGPAVNEPVISEKGESVTMSLNGVQQPAQDLRHAPADQPDAPAAHGSASAPATPVELMAQLQAHQREILQVHQQFLTNQHEYVRLLLQLPQSGAAYPESSLAAMHAIQSETLRIHQQFLTQQGDYAAGLLQVIQASTSQGIALSTSQDVATSTPQDVALSTSQDVALSTSQDVALSTAQDVATSTAQDVATSTVSTPQDVATSTVSAPQDVATSTVSTPQDVATSTVSAPQDVATSTASTPSSALPAHLIEGLLTVVSEKTGYPRETLELEMDMESDLGIDSIKRVDILGTMQTRFTLPRLAPEELAELRTLAQVVAHLQAVAPFTSQDVAPFTSQDVAPFTSQDVAPFTSQDVATSTVSAPQDVAPFTSQDVATSTASTPSSALPAHLIEGLLTVVSEKTGYPRETLELDMDMESDLGIDSIKRVDILGTMQTRFTLPRLAPEELAELRTLAQVVAHLQAVAPSTAQDVATSTVSAPQGLAPFTSQDVAPFTAQDVATSTASTPSSALPAHLIEGLLTVVSEKTGYPRETLELDMDMESDLGIDSIKRVDILGTMQTRFTLPRLAPEELAELRTLAQVVAHLQAVAPSAPQGIAPFTSQDVAPFTSQDVAMSTASAPQHGATFTASAPFTSFTTSTPAAPARLVRLPAPDQLEAAPPDGWSCVITDDGTQATGLLAAALSERGWQPVVLRLPTAVVAERPALPRGVGRVALPDMSEEQLAQALQMIAESYGPIGGFIHLHPQPAAMAKSNGMLSEAEQQIVRMVFLAAKHLAPGLTTAGRSGRALFMTVTRMDGALGTGMTRPVGPVGGGLFGLVKTLRQEWAAVFCRAVDLSPEFAAAQVADLIVAESNDPDMRLLEVGYGVQGRVTLAAELSLGGA